MSSAPPASDRGRFVVNVLDPRTAQRVPGHEPPRRTLYFADRLMVAGDLDLVERPVAAALTLTQTSAVSEGASLRGCVRDAGFDLRSLDETSGRMPLASFAGTGGGSASPGTRIYELVATGAGTPPDAWTVLQGLRASHPELAGRVSLEHVVRPCGGYWDGIGGYWPGIGGAWDGIGGYWPGIGGYWPGIGGATANGGSENAEYGIAGRGGRLPVSVVLADPSTDAPRVARHPVVVMPDSGLGEHQWFSPDDDPRAYWDAARRHPKVLRRTGIGLERNVDREALPDPMTGRYPHLAGHGTFIAGLVRQGCPSATLLPVPVLTEIGTAEESMVVRSLQQLLDLHRRARAQLGAQPDVAVPLADPDEEDVRAYLFDVITLSIGFYVEAVPGAQGESIADVRQGPVGQVLRDLGDEGVLVVAGTGNDATTDPFVPADLAEPIVFPQPGAEEDAPLPLVSVGALNPDGETIAMFSNPGGTVTAYRPGVSVVSTLPRRNSGTQPTLRVPGDDPRHQRATVDPDDYSQGFGVWSGTSFAAPTFAADVARHLVVSGKDLADVSRAAMRRRGWAALRALLASEDDVTTDPVEEDAP